MTQGAPVYTIGHSTHPFAEFVALLRESAVSAIADVRSTPYSRWQPQYNSKELRRQLAEHDIAYVFLGAELGGRGTDDSVFDHRGRVQYGRIADSPLFQEGLRRVQSGRMRMRLALMCTERDPIDCHRGLLISRILVAAGTDVLHIHANGQTETHRHAEQRLRQLAGLDRPDLFRTEEDLLAEAYERQEARVAYVKPSTMATADRVQ
jgi:uncharacterized protein (DUF488 family)